MNNSYQQLTTNLEYLKLKQMAQHLGEVVDFSINNQLSFVEALVKLTNYEIDVREQKYDSFYGKMGHFLIERRLMYLILTSNQVLINNKF